MLSFDLIYEMMASTSIKQLDATVLMTTSAVLEHMVLGQGRRRAKEAAVTGGHILLKDPSLAC